MRAGRHGRAGPTSDPTKFRGLVESSVQIRMLGAFGVGMTAVNLMVRARSAIPASRDVQHNLALHNALGPPAA